jgi:hypothetical protein
VALESELLGKAKRPAAVAVLLHLFPRAPRRWYARAMGWTSARTCGQGPLAHFVDEAVAGGRAAWAPRSYLRPACQARCQYSTATAVAFSVIASRRSAKQSPEWQREIASLRSTASWRWTGCASGTPSWRQPVLTINLALSLPTTGCRDPSSTTALASCGRIAPDCVRIAS